MTRFQFLGPHTAPHGQTGYIPADNREHHSFAELLEEQPTQLIRALPNHANRASEKTGHEEQQSEVPHDRSLTCRTVLMGKGKCGQAHNGNQGIDQYPGGKAGEPRCYRVEDVECLLNNDQRRENVRGKMSVSSDRLPNLGGAILLLDDYVGSSSTLKEAVRAIRKSGGFRGEIVPFAVVRVRWRLGAPGMV